MSGALRRELHRGCFWISAGQQCLARLAALGVSGGGEGLASHLGQGSFVSVFGASLPIANCGIAQFPSPSRVSVNKAGHTKHNTAGKFSMRLYPIHTKSNSHKHNSLS